MNLINYGYFNLNGNFNKFIYEDILKIDLDYLIGIDKNFIFCKIINLDNNIFDFREFKKLEEFFKVDDE